MIVSRASRGLAILGGLVAASLASAAAPQDGTVAIRSGDHPGFGRIVVDTSAQAAYQVDQSGDHVVVRFLSPVTLGDPPRPPRNVASIRLADGTIELSIKAGSSIRSDRIGDRFVIDVMDPGRTAAASASKASEPAKTQRPPAQTTQTTMTASPELGGRHGPAEPPGPPAPIAAATAAPQPAAAASGPPASPAPAQRTPVQTRPMAPPAAPSGPPLLEVTRQPQSAQPEADRPVALLARRVKPPKGMDGSAVLLPFSDTTGAAAFREGDITYVVFDERRPIDMVSLRSDPVFGQATVQTLPNGTLLAVPLPPSLSVAVTQTAQGWRVAALTAVPKPQPIGAIQASGRLTLPAELVGEVVSLADPDTGATLLVGTQRRPGQAVAHGRLAVEFILRPTLQGVVVEPLSDTVALKATPSGFTLGGGPAGLALSEPGGGLDGLIDASSLTRRLKFATNTHPDGLMRHLTEQVSDAAMTPPMARGPKHRAAAESMILLGMDAEAESLLRIAAEQDPKEGASADTAALTGVAALLAGRPNEADGLDDPRLTGTDEIALWRAVRQAMQDPGSPVAAAVFATTAPMAASYPAAVRDRILPLILETMIQGGEIGPAARLLDQRPDDPGLAYARALRVQAEGDTDKALAMLDALANGRDQSDRARAAVRAADLRLAARKIDAAAAADALDKLLYAWRGDDRELALRERVAALRAQTGSWREALSGLRQAETDFPDQAAAVHDRLKDTFAAIIRDQDVGKMPALDFVAMVDENADMISGPDDEDAIAQPLADRLVALDLPGRAKPLLEKLMRSAATDAGKARLGASLARLLSRENDDAGALAALDASEAPGLPADLVQQRTILRANALARRGDAAGGAAILAALKTGPAAAARARILENAGDWAGAAQAWTECAGLTVPESGPVDEAATRTIVSLATATARSGDEQALAALRAKYADRIGGGALGDMVRLLTAEPVRTAKDIGRAKQETHFADSLPAGLKALQAATVAR
jgi:tetratricopeptide (TPR) repeat protein